MAPSSTPPPRHSLARDLNGQFSAAWSLLGDAIGDILDDQWRTGESDHLVPARLALHIIETAEHYSSEDPASYRWGARFNLDWESAPSQNLPGQHDIQRYLADVKKQVREWIEKQGDDGLLAPDSHYGGEGMSHFDRAAYLLRHTHHHIGELCAELRRRGIPRPRWR